MSRINFFFLVLCPLPSKKCSKLSSLLVAKRFRLAALPRGRMQYCRPILTCILALSRPLLYTNGNARIEPITLSANAGREHLHIHPSIHLSMHTSHQITPHMPHAQRTSPTSQPSMSPFTQPQRTTLQYQPANIPAALVQNHPTRSWQAACTPARGSSGSSGHLLLTQEMNGLSAC